MKLKQIRKVKFDALTHSYWCGDKELVGVTSLMRHQGLSANYDGIPAEVLANAAERGTQFHKALEDYDNNKQIVLPLIITDLSNKTYDYSQEFKDYSRLGLNVLASEYLVSDCKVVATMIDKVIFVDENTVDLADIKTTSILHEDSVSVQLSLCAYLFELQNKGIKVRNLYAVHCKGHTTMVQVKRYDNEEMANLIAAESRGEIYPLFPNAIEGATNAISETEEKMLFQAEANILALKELLAKAEEEAKAVKEKLCAYMIDHNLTEMSSPLGIIKLRKESTRDTFDSKAFKAAHPELAEKYTKTSIVKPSISIKRNA